MTIRTIGIFLGAASTALVLAACAQTNTASTTPTVGSAGMMNSAMGTSGAGMMTSAFDNSGAGVMTSAMGGASGMMSGISTAGPSTSSAVHNAADVMFAQQMTVHHQGAIAMADLAPGRAVNADVLALAVRIKAAQAPEIAEMTAWLSSWNVGMTASSGMGTSGMGTSGRGTSGMGMGGASSAGAAAMPGMMSDAQMSELTAASGAAFDKLFLQLMIVHHQGAIEMSATEKGTGSNPEALALAESISTSQTQEITEMNQLLQSM